MIGQKLPFNINQWDFTGFLFSTFNFSRCLEGS